MNFLKKSLSTTNVFCISIAFIILITGCSGEKGVGENPSTVEYKPAFGDMYIEASIADAITLNPVLTADSASGNINGYVFNGLVKYNKDIVLVGDLAESWDLSDDRKSIVFKLRNNVKWHDGIPFTARDVEFTYKKLIDPSVMTPHASEYLLVKEFKVIDDYTIKINYDKPFSLALESWGMGIIPEHIFKEGDFNKHPANSKPIGTGPYRFVRWISDERIELEYNTEYFEGRPYIDRIICRKIPDEAVQFMELRKGDIDSMSLTPDQYALQTNYPEFKRNYNKFRYPGFGYTYMGYNLTNPLFSEKNVRRAITYAINRESIIEGVLQGMGSICTGPFPEQSWAYNPNVARYDYNPEKAKKLLEEHGWTDSDNDGILDKDGKPFKFTIMTNHGNKKREMTATIIQSDLKKIGIEVDIRIIEWSAFIKNHINKRDFEAIIIGWGLSRDPDCYSIWHSSQKKEGQYNFVSYSNPEVDRLIIEGREVFDIEKRKKIYYRIHEILASDQPYSFLFVPDSLPVVTSRIQGIKVAPIGIGYNFIKWYVPTGLQKYTN